MKITAAAVVAVVAFADASWACINGMRAESPRIDVVAKANNAYRAGRYAEALVVAEEGLQAGQDAPRTRGLLRTLGLSGLKLGEFEKSIDALSRLADQRKDPFVEVKLAEARLRKASRNGAVNEEALAAIEKLASDGLLSDADAWTAVGSARLAKQDVTGAKAACEAALKIQPGHPEAQALLQSLPATPKSPDQAKPAKS